MTSNYTSYTDRIVDCKSFAIVNFWFGKISRGIGMGMGEEPIKGHTKVFTQHLHIIQKSGMSATHIACAVVS